MDELLRAKEVGRLHWEAPLTKAERRLAFGEEDIDDVAGLNFKTKAHKGHQATVFFKTLDNVLTPVSLAADPSEIEVYTGADCERRCMENLTPFPCEAFVWAGKGFPCYLYGSIVNQTVPVVPGSHASLFQRLIKNDVALDTQKHYAPFQDCEFVNKVEISGAYAAERGRLLAALYGMDAFACGAHCWAARPHCEAYVIIQGHCFHFDHVPYYIPLEYEDNNDYRMLALSCDNENRDIPIPYANNTADADTKIRNLIKLLRRPVPQFVDYVTFDTERGKMRGRIMEINGMQLTSWQKVPYAEVPTGILRYNKTVLRSPWSPEVMDAAGARAPHCGGTVDDCLYLEIYTTRTNQSEDTLKRPVMVWVHGGHFAGGSNEQYSDAGFMRNLATRDVVVVSIQYRLHIAGWWTTKDHAASGNWGMWDQVAALKWIQQEIHHFGGDPAQVTVHGESAGGASSSLLNRSPHVHSKHETFTNFNYNGFRTDNERPLIKYAIPQSGVAMNIWAAQAEGPADAHVLLANATGCLVEGNTFATAACMRNASLDDIAKGWIEIRHTQGGVILPWGPRVDGLDPDGFPNFQPDYTTQLKPAAEAVMIGCTHDEFGSYAYGGGFGGVATSEKSLINDLNKYINEDNIGPQHGMVRSIFENMYLNPSQERYTLLMNDDDPSNDPDSFYWARESIFVKSLLFWFLGALQETIDLTENWNQTVYLYSFDYVSKEGFQYAPFPPGAFHGYELVFLMELNMDFYGEDLMSQIVQPHMVPDDMYVLQLMGDIWTNFARHGTPTPGEGYVNRDGSRVLLAPFDAWNYNFFSINTTGISAHNDYYRRDMEVWIGLLGQANIRFGG